MSFLGQVLILSASLLILAKSAELVVRNLIKIANILRWSTFIVSFIILGIFSSTPEIFVGINSVMENTPQLSLGNVIGASIVLLTLVVGLTATITGKVVVDSTFAKKDLFIMNIVILLPILLLYDGRLTRIDSLIMYFAYGIYVYRMYKERHKLSHPIANLNHSTQFTKSISLLILGFLGLALSSNFAVDSA